MCNHYFMSSPHRSTSFFHRLDGHVKLAMRELPIALLLEINQQPETISRQSTAQRELATNRSSRRISVVK